MTIAVDRVEVLVLAENWVDMLLPEYTNAAGGVSVKRNGLIEHFDFRRVKPVAENGLSLLVTAYLGDRTYTVMFDAGLTAHAMQHNIAALGVDQRRIDSIVVSHAHPDHVGGIFGVLDGIKRPIPLITHWEAFLPRFAVMGDARTAANYNAEFSERNLAQTSANTILSTDPVHLWAGIATTGEIPRHVEFESPAPFTPSDQPPGPGLFQIRDGRWDQDLVMDEQALIINVAEWGLVVLTGCAHAGVINTIVRAKDIFKGANVRCVMGGFHLGFPTTPAKNIALTVDALSHHGVEYVVPMHCSGLDCHSATKSRFGETYLQPAVGTLFTFGRAV